MTSFGMQIMDLVINLFTKSITKTKKASAKGTTKWIQMRKLPIGSTELSVSEKKKRRRPHEEVQQKVYQI